MSVPLPAHALKENAQGWIEQQCGQGAVPVVLTVKFNGENGTPHIYRVE